MADESHVTLKSLNCFTDLFLGSNLPWPYADSEITFSHGLHKNLVTVLYLSIINVLCGAGGDASFAPQANIVYNLRLSKCSKLFMVHLIY